MIKTEIFQNVDKSIAEKKPFHLNYRLKHKSGSWLMIEEHGIGVFNDKDELILLEGVLLDITERRKAVEERDRLFNLSIDMLSISGFDGYFKQVNPAWMKNLGWSEEELFSKPYLSFVHPEDQAVSVAAHEELKHGETLSAFENRYVCKDGSVRWFSWNSFPLTDKNLIFSVVHDISVRKRREKEMETMRRISRKLTEPLSLKEVGRLLANESRNLFNHDAFSLSYYDLEKNISIEVYCEDVPEGGKEPMEMPPTNVPLEVINKSATFLGQTNLINRKEESEYNQFVSIGNKTRRSKSLMFAPILWANNKIGSLSAQSYTPNKYNKEDLKLLETFASECGGALIRVRGEEERQKLQLQVQQTQKLESLGILAGGIAHDFNNLLMGILGNASLALTEVHESSPARENLEQIEKSAYRAAELCKQMLAYSGRGKFVVESINLSVLIEEMVKLLEISISKKAILKLDLLKDIPNIDADPTQIRQILMNLVINASEAIGDKPGVITITSGTTKCDRNYLENIFIDDTLPEGLYAYLEVSDSGCGMDQETMKKIFDPFYTTKFTGRGLGLAAVLGIVRGHKGTIKVYSEPNKGTSFKVLLPCSEKVPNKLKTNIKHEEPLNDTGTILIIDDEETVCKVAKQMLEALGYDVLTAINGMKGVEIFEKKSNEIKLVLLDMTMPFMDGEETFRELKKIKKDLCVILTSGYNEQEATSKFIGKGLAGFIQKPFLLGELKEKLRNIISTHYQKGTL